MNPKGAESLGCGLLGVPCDKKSDFSNVVFMQPRTLLRISWTIYLILPDPSAAQPFS